ncbi:carboxypeptidase-like regulatory domain-containing protein [Ferruginibacter lapsinanis]|uniref:carboxypeptidase-like regulatory domain-containing protein n=1 Tax=Ferruginibacter lapsinanis TaxID=563172 RepID=UPI001E340E5F|nr:carboxypeptidase-like regulatory domain-containing protein [Ferruginibacter lapsinanis]UEG50189.1 carboxypeptidase-like regulatory domain-containing protein [Ferruginibacter lapsinanis]
MKKFLLYIFIAICFLPTDARAQFETFKDSVVQLYGVVMTADSLQGLPAVTVLVKGQNRGTVTNNQGVFSIVVLKGDEIDFSSIGYKPKSVVVPREIEGNEYSVIQLMVTDTVYLAATVIKSRPRREQFERDFLNTQVPADNLEIARQNNDEAKRKILMSYLPRDGQEAQRAYFNKQANKTYYAGQNAPMNILNPFAWNEFIKAWKRGDFKSKK